MTNDDYCKYCRPEIINHDDFKILTDSRMFYRSIYNNNKGKFFEGIKVFTGDPINDEIQRRILSDVNLQEYIIKNNYSIPTNAEILGSEYWGI